VAALGPRLQAVSETIQFKPRVNGSIFRLQRHTRFSKGKAPYKTHLDLWFREGDRRGWETPGFFFRMFHERLILGAGIQQLGKEQLAAYREAVIGPKRGKALVRALHGVREPGPYEIGDATRKKVPRGFDPDHERAALLVHEGLWAAYEGHLPPEAKTAAFVGWCAEKVAHMEPVSRWLLGVVAGGG
jgi:uncharacterized protein (TIGR02453 family)